MLFDYHLIEIEKASLPKFEITFEYKELLKTWPIEIIVHAPENWNIYELDMFGANTEALKLGCY